MATSRTWRPGYRTGLVAITFAACCISTVWALTMPYFDGPDEYAHFNSIVRLLSGDGWPDAYEAPMLAVTWQAFVENGGRVPWFEVMDSVVPWLRSSLDASTPLVAAGVDNMVQHPPAYYVVIAAVLEVFGGTSLRWDVAFIVARMTTAVMQSAALPLLVGSVRVVTNDRRAALWSGSMVAAIPFFLTMGGYVTNDALLVLAGAAATYFGLRLVFDARTRVSIAAIAGASFGVMLLTKGFALLLAPVLLMLVIVGIWRAPQRGVATVIVRGAIPVVVAGGVGAWWWVRNLVVYGTLQPSLLGERVRLEEPFAGYDLAEFVATFVLRMSSTFWGRGGRPPVAYEEWVTSSASIVLIASVVLGVIVMRQRGVAMILLGFPSLIVGALLSNAHGIYWDLGAMERGVQGRYLFAGITAVLVPLGGGMAWATSYLHERLAAALRWSTALGAWLVAVGALHWSVQRADDVYTYLASPARDFGVAVPVMLAIAAIVLAIVAVVADGWLERPTSLTSASSG